jgi:hypothetical protein
MYKWPASGSVEPGRGNIDTNGQPMAPLILAKVIYIQTQAHSCVDPGTGNVHASGQPGYVEVGLTRESLFETLARSETRFLKPKFSRDSRETRESKLVARLASRESHRQKFCSENREKRVLLRNFVARIASYESRRNKFRSKTRLLRVSQTNFVVRLASLANRKFVASLARIITNFNSRVLRESCENFGSNTHFLL